MIPAGTYLARGVPSSPEWGQGDNNGNEYLQVEYAFEEDPLLGQAMAKRYYFTDAAIEISIEGLRKSGCTFPGGDITNLEGFGSKQVRLVIEHKTYEGKTRANIKFVNGTGPIVKNPLGVAALASLKQRAKGQLFSTATSQPAKSGMLPAAPFDDKDIPF